MLRLACRVRPLRSVPVSPRIRLKSTVAPPLIRLERATCYEQYPTPGDTSQPFFRTLSFVLPSKPLEEDAFQPQKWAVIGLSDKTKFLEFLNGQHVSVPPDARSHPYLLTEELAAKNPRARFVRHAIRYLGFSGEGSGATGGTRGAYLSARYESLREETDWTVRQYLRGQTSLNPLAEEKDGTVHDEEQLGQVISDLSLEALLDMPVANLSNGQMRRTRIAKALLSKPEVLLLDDPFMGLDPRAAQKMSGLLNSLADKSEPRLILALGPQDLLPDWITHTVILADCQQILYKGRRSGVDRLIPFFEKVAKGHRPGPTLNEGDEPFEEGVEECYTKLMSTVKTDFSHGRKRTIASREFIQELVACWKRSSSEGAAQVKHDPPRGGEPLIEMDGVRVQYGDKAVLGNWSQSVDGQSKEGLHWTVRRGQRWAVLGANGSGKTTLLSLITSDHPQTYALPIRLFGRSRLPEAGKPGISIFELQRRIGHSSPEVHAFFPRQLTVRESLESAFADTFLARPKLSYELDLDVEALLDHFRPELYRIAELKGIIEPPRSTRGIKGPITKELMSLFPRDGYFFHKHYEPLGQEYEWADKITFGELPLDLQRLVLFLRALVHRPDIVILDEAFSGMSPSLRQKCHEFLEHGAGRFRGLTDQQALVMISHSYPEIPRIVRYYMRLPSADEEAGQGFRFGPLRSTSAMNDRKVWQTIWSSRETFESEAERADPEQAPTGEPVREDFKRYEWQSV
ncbi:putative ABC transporter [Aspergillus saccharolyticus JOP 1030-1]|uniref:ABC transporter n=1 Tax=Aspergillus saccharolyticus JOP 1030-1 TaxID=1450539 RepID=A0A319AEF9_9EURO|nr:ABC transporter [Aspergillus saccharolyticus JOP 1030-1]PYH49878.1 ABC transporter [Aspergillus saccharolyticus JOP 1030-1]